MEREKAAYGPCENSECPRLPPGPGYAYPTPTGPPPFRAPSGGAAHRACAAAEAGAGGRGTGAVPGGGEREAPRMRAVCRRSLDIGAGARAPHCRRAQDHGATTADPPRPPGGR